MTTVQAVVSSMDGIVVLRDASETAVADIRLAVAAARQGGSQRGGGQVAGVAGGALIIRCVDQYSAPTLLIRVQDGPSAQDEAGWRWLPPSVIALKSGNLTLDSNGEQSGWERDVAVGAPGRYAVRLGHRGRDEFQSAAVQVRVETLNASDQDRTTAWESLRGVERYAIDMWPEQAL